MKNNVYIGDRTPIVANGRLYEFGHYTKTGCVIYKKGEFATKEPLKFKLDEIHLPTTEELKTLNWG